MSTSKCVVLSSLISLLVFAPTANTENRSSNTADSVVAASYIPDFNPMQLRRHFWKQNGTSGYHFTGWWLPNTWETRYVEEGTLGFVSVTPFAGSHAIYNCLVPVAGKSPSPFTSVDPNCEPGAGYPNTLHGFTGYVSTQPRAGFVPLYRCNLFVPGHPHHFDSFSSTCEGSPSALEGVLGYVALTAP